MLHFSEATQDVFSTETIIHFYNYFIKNGFLFFIEVQQQGVHQQGAEWVPIGDIALTKDTMPIQIGDAKYRNKGIGKAAIHLVCEFAKSIGYKKIQLAGIYTYNHRSKRAYEANDFKIVDTVIDEEGKENWIMERIF